MKCNCDGPVLAGLRLPAPRSVRGRYESTVAVSMRPLASVQLSGTLSFDVKVRGREKRSFLPVRCTAWLGPVGAHLYERSYERSTPNLQHASSKSCPAPKSVSFQKRSAARNSSSSDMTSYLRSARTFDQVSKALSASVLAVFVLKNPSMLLLSRENL